MKSLRTVCRNYLVLNGSRGVFCSNDRFLSTITLNIPNIMDTKAGRIERWLKKEGDPFKSGETLCEVSLEPSQLTVGVEAPLDGILAEIVVRELKAAGVNEPIARIVDSKDAYLTFLEDQRIEIIEDEKSAIVSQEAEKQHSPPDNATLIKEVKHLIDEGHIERGSEFSRKLLGMARKGHPELMSIFRASFEGASFNRETFDKKFFVDNARDIVVEEEKSSAKAVGP